MQGNFFYKCVFYVCNVQVVSKTKAKQQKSMQVSLSEFWNVLGNCTLQGIDKAKNRMSSIPSSLNNFPQSHFNFITIKKNSTEKIVCLHRIPHFYY